MFKNIFPSCLFFISTIILYVVTNKTLNVWQQKSISGETIDLCTIILFLIEQISQANCFEINEKTQVTTTNNKGIKNSDIPLSTLLYCVCG